MNTRRKFLQLLGLSVWASQLPVAALGQGQTIVKPRRLKQGDTVGLISPGGYIEREDLNAIAEFISDNGLNVKVGDHVLDSYGYLAGRDKDRAADVNAMFADDAVGAILTMRGGWGCNRILPLLDYDLIGSHPKIIMGYSDITSLLLAIYARTGTITFHGPVGISNWNSFSVGYVRRILFHGEMVKMENPPDMKVNTITKGKVRGRLLGGNLSVLAAMVGSSYLPSWEGSILFVEEIGEDIYRVDRMLTQLKLAGILEQLAGFIFAQCSQCPPKEDDDPALTLPQVLWDHIKPLGIPAWYGSAIGHIRDKFTVPLGVEVEIDSVSGTIQMLEYSVM